MYDTPRCSLTKATSSSDVKHAGTAVKSRRQTSAQPRSELLHESVCGFARR